MRWMAPSILGVGSSLLIASTIKVFKSLRARIPLFNSTSSSPSIGAVLKVRVLTWSLLFQRPIDPLAALSPEQIRSPLT
jgi:hypothetical protein